MRQPQSSGSKAEESSPQVADAPPVGVAGSHHVDVLVESDVGCESAKKPGPSVERIASSAFLLPDVVSGSDSRQDSVEADPDAETPMVDGSSLPAHVTMALKQAAITTWAHVQHSEAMASLVQSGDGVPFALESLAYFDIGELVLPFHGKLCKATLSRYTAEAGDDVLDGTSVLHMKPSIWSLTGPPNPSMANLTVVTTLCPSVFTRVLGGSPGVDGVPEDAMAQLQFCTQVITNHVEIHPGDTLYLDSAKPASPVEIESAANSKRKKISKVADGAAVEGTVEDADGSGVGSSGGGGVDPKPKKRSRKSV